LPYFEQSELRDLIDTTQPWFDFPPEVLRTRIEVFECPSDTTHPITITALERLGPGTHAVSSYNECKGVNDALSLSASFRAQDLTSWSGIFDLNSHIRMADIIDGSSNTMAFGEAASGKSICVGIDCSIPRLEGVGSGHGWALGGYSTQPLFDAGYVISGGLSSTVERLNKDPVTDSFRDLTRAQDLTPSFMGGTHRVSNFRSFHPGGGFFLMADGSVHFINDSIDMPTYRALSTIQGGDIAILE